MLFIFFARSCIPRFDNISDVENTFECVSEKLTEYADILITMIAGDKLTFLPNLSNIDFKPSDAASINDVDSQQNSQFAEVTKYILLKSLFTILIINSIHNIRTQQKSQLFLFIIIIDIIIIKITIILLLYLRYI